MPEDFIAEHTLDRCFTVEGKLNFARFLVYNVAADCAGAVKNFRAHLLLHTFGFCGGVWVWV